MEKLVPKHIHHDQEEAMAKKSEVFILPVSLENEARYQDCIHIIDQYEQYINRWYTKTGRAKDLDNMLVPVGGDQLTRVRLQGAKSLRAGAHTASEKFEHLNPIIIEMFHTMQDFLEVYEKIKPFEKAKRKRKIGGYLAKMCKKFLDLNQSRDQGTLSNLKVLVQRTNVNGNVKSRFKAHEDFILTCGLAYLHDYIRVKFQMRDMNDFPRHPSIQPNIKLWNSEPKRKVFNEVMDESIADLFIPFKMKEMEIKDVSIGTHTFAVNVENKDPMTIKLDLNGTKYSITTRKETLKNGVSLKVDAGNLSLTIQDKKPKKDLNLKTYIQNFLQWYFVIIQMKDAVREGDSKRLKISLKSMVPFFYGHSVLSKYLVECIDYVLKTEHTLSPYMAQKVLNATFVNTKGKKGKNKAADMHKENEVKYLKSLIKSLGVNKTEKSIVAITKAGPVIQDILENFAEMVDSKVKSTVHKTKSREDDLTVMRDHLKKLNIWGGGNNPITADTGFTPFDFDRESFKGKVVSIVERLLMDLPEVIEEGEIDLQVEE